MVVWAQSNNIKKRCEGKKSGIKKLKSPNFKFARPGQSNCSVLVHLCFSGRSESAAYLANYYNPFSAVCIMVPSFYL